MTEKDCDREELPEPLHGHLVCIKYKDQLSCSTTCDVDHVLNPMDVYHSAHCGPGGLWKHRFPQDYPAKACLSRCTLWYKKVESTKRIPI